MELFHTFIQSSIAVLAFSAIVVEFRRRSKQNLNLRQYQGIIGHTMQAFTYSCLPIIGKEFIHDETLLWQWCGGILGFFTFLQGATVLFVDKASSAKIRLMMFGASTLVSVLQLSYIFKFIESGIGVYSIGVFWHLLQSLLIISVFIMDPGLNNDVNSEGAKNS